MTTKNELLELFNISPDTPRIVGFAGSAIHLVTSKDHEAAVITAPLLKPVTWEDSGKWVCLQARPEDAVVLAKLILQKARERGWPDVEIETSTTKFPTKNQQH